MPYRTLLGGFRVRICWACPLIIHTLTIMMRLPYLPWKMKPNANYNILIGLLINLRRFLSSTIAEKRHLQHIQMINSKYTCFTLTWALPGLAKGTTWSTFTNKIRRGLQIPLKSDRIQKTFTFRSKISSIRNRMKKVSKDLWKYWTTHIRIQIINHRCLSFNKTSLTEIISDQFSARSLRYKNPKNIKKKADKSLSL